MLSLHKLTDASRLLFVFFLCFYLFMMPFCLLWWSWEIIYQHFSGYVVSWRGSWGVCVCVCVRPGLGRVFLECLREHLRISSAWLCSRETPCGVLLRGQQRLSPSLSLDFNARNVRKATSNPTPSEMKCSGTKRYSETSHLCIGLLYVVEANLRRLFDGSGPSADVTSSSLFSVLWKEPQIKESLHESKEE